MNKSVENTVSHDERFVSIDYQNPNHHKMHRASEKVNVQEDGEDVYIKPKTQLGPSKFASILGLNSFETAKQLSDKLSNGYWMPDRSLALKHGIQLESTALEWYSKLMNTPVKKANWLRRLPVNGRTRICGIADGLIGADGGVEIKCHYTGKMCNGVPDWYLPQVLGYLFLYDRKWWDFMSCVFDDQNKLIKCCITRVYREDHHDRWKKWWQIIRLFCINQWRKKTPAK